LDTKATDQNIAINMINDLWLDGSLEGILAAFYLHLNTFIRLSATFQAIIHHLWRFLIGIREKELSVG
jgi:hypothetical protein